MSAHSTFEPVKFKLSAQITTHKGVLDELTLNMPPASAFLRYGSPLIETTKGVAPNIEYRLSYDYAAVMGFLKEMTGHDDIILSTIPANDMPRLANTVWSVLSFTPKTSGKLSEHSDASERS